jgi:hypothetical protein
VKAVEPNAGADDIPAFLSNAPRRLLDLCRSEARLARSGPKGEGDDENAESHSTA